MCVCVCVCAHVCVWGGGGGGGWVKAWVMSTNILAGRRGGGQGRQLHETNIPS